MKSLETIVSAAVWIERDGWRTCHFFGRRHHDCIHQAVSDVPDLWRQARMDRATRQGFLTNRGRLVDRSEAAKIALVAGQMSRIQDELFNEDVIP